MLKMRVLVFLVVVAVAGLVTVGSAQAQLTHRYSFTTDLTDSVGDADGTAQGDSGVAGGQAILNLGFFGAARDGRINLLANGANGINVNTYSGLTVEFWATPNCDTLALGCDPNPNDSFSTAFSLGNTYGPPDLPAPEIGPTGAGADYVIMQTHRGDNASRGAIAITNELVQGAPWGAETGVNGPEFNDGGEHHYALVIDDLCKDLTWYVDGVNMGTAALADPNSHGLANLLSGLSNMNAWIGSGYEIDQKWSGAMNELRIFNAASSDAYIANSVAAGPEQLTEFIEHTCIPEPASLGLALLGFCSLRLLRRRY